jgi:hypothetical protein
MSVAFALTAGCASAASGPFGPPERARASMDASSCSAGGTAAQLTTWLTAVLLEIGAPLAGDVAAKDVRTVDGVVKIDMPEQDGRTELAATPKPPDLANIDLSLLPELGRRGDYVLHGAPAGVDFDQYLVVGPDRWIVFHVVPQREPPADAAFIDWFGEYAQLQERCA